MLAKALLRQQAAVQAEVKMQAAPVAMAPPPGAMAPTAEAVPPPQGAWKGAAAGGGGGGYGDDDDEEEEVEDGFLLRQMALRQYIEVLRQPALAGRSSIKPWKLTLRRDALCADVLAAMSKVRGHGELWRQTQVVFIDRHGRSEDGIDDGGLTAEAHGAFWREALSSSANLFVSAADSSGATVLPRRGANADVLRRAGRMLCKSLLDDHPIGAGLCAFALEYLIGMHEQRSLRTPRSALAALAHFDPVLAAQWRVLLERTDDPTRLDGLCFSDLDGSDDLPLGREGDQLRATDVQIDLDAPLSEHNVAAAVLAGCKARLLGGRRDALEALREGFSGFVDLSVQLAPLPTSELLLMVQGRVSISAQQLDECFDWGAEAFPPFPLHSNAVRLFRAFVRGGLTPPQRLQLLRWCTAQNALPVDGLKEKITFKHFVSGGGGGGSGRDATADERLPVAHTCSFEVELPDYSSGEPLREKLLRAMQEMEGGGGFAVQ